MTGRLGGVREHWVFALLLLIGTAIRVYTLVLYQPAGLSTNDTAPFIAMAQDELFSDPGRSPGLPLLMRVLRWFFADVTWTIGVFHLLGLASGVLIYSLVYRASGAKWAAAIAGGAFVIEGGLLFLEHSLLTESPFTFFLVAMLFAAVRSLYARGFVMKRVPRSVCWLVVAAIALGMASWFRPVTQPLAVLFPIWVLVAFGALPWRRRLVAAVAVLVVAVGTVAVVPVARAALAGGAGGLGVDVGLYSRVAQFADCSEFTPPPGTEGLCETSDPTTRPGPDFYGHQGGSPLFRVYGTKWLAGPEVGEWARAAILNQPLDYVGAVATDFMRYFGGGGFGRARFLNGYGYEAIDFGSHLRGPDTDPARPGREAGILAAINSYYAPESINISPRAARYLHNYQEVARFGPSMMLLASVLGVVGMVLARGRTRWVIILLLGVALIVLLVPVAALLWNARYGVPAIGPLVAAGALGLATLAARPSRTSRPSA